MTTRIQWSVMERAAIAQQIRAILVGNPVHHSNKALLAEAQLVLPMSRRRKITDGATFALKDWINAIRNEPRSRPEPVPVPQPVLYPIPAPPKPVNSIGELALSLVREITREVMREMRAEREREEAEREGERVSAGIARDNDRQQGRENTKLRDHIAQGEIEKSQRLSIAILGIQPAQANTVGWLKNYRGRNVDFEFYDSNEAAARRPVQRDVVIMMTKFVSHSVQERWRPMVPKTSPPSFYYCNGGVSELCAVINRALSDSGY